MMKIACLLLAAGDSSRMQGKNKLMLKVDGKSMVRKTLEEISKVSFHQMIVVTGFEQDKITNELRDLKPDFSHNSEFESGMHSSIRAGLKAMDPSVDGFFVCLSDQPYFDHKNLEAVIRVSKSSLKTIFIPTFDQQRGHPVLISTSFLPEILKEADGDYGLAYLLKRHPEAVESVEIDSREILIDVDAPEDYAKILNKSYDTTDPVEEFHQLVAQLRSERKSFAIASIIEVIGSASAKTGSKAIFTEDGMNLSGWVGGGCAERFIGEESAAAIKDKKTRIILADMDDEIFGLGVACGGKMRVFIDPILPAETIRLPETEKFSHELRTLSSFYGWNVKKDHAALSPQTIEELLLTMSKSVAEKRNKSNRSLRLVKEVPAKFLNPKTKLKKEVTIVGRTRITEALARHFTLLSYSVRAIGPDLRSEDYPSNVQCSCLEDGYQNIDFKEGEVVIIAGHTAQDPVLVEKALSQKAGYVGMIGSYKRSLEVLNHLQLLNQEITSPLYVPAGLDLDAQNPDEIALSIVCEVLHES